MLPLVTLTWKNTHVGKVKVLLADPKHPRSVFHHSNLLIRYLERMNTTFQIGCKLYTGTRSFAPSLPLSLSLSLSLSLFFKINSTAYREQS